jgi:hypothetical protein
MKRNFPILVLLTLFLIVLGFLCIKIVQFDRHSLQMDFSAYYTAGESLDHGYSPYLNNYSATPPIWDGINFYKNSRFLYPPLVANLFQLFALIPYSVAKVIWSFINLAAIFYALYCLIGMLVKEKRKKIIIFLLSSIAVCLFFPIFTYFERGQVDTITLLFLVKGIQYLVKGKHGRSGVFFALAMLIKINIIIILPIFLIKKYRKAIPTLAITFGVICLLTLVLNPWTIVKNYVTADFPRIVKYNEGGLSENLISAGDLIKANQGFPLSNPHKQGIGYQKEYFSFTGNGALTRTSWMDGIKQAFHNWTFIPANLSVNLLLYLISLGLCTFLIFKTKSLDHPDSEILLWGLILVIILLISPLTWVMNLVWLLFIFPIFFIQLLGLIKGIKNHSGILKMIVLLFGLLGLILIALPDVALIPANPANATGLLLNKYPIGELLVLCWLVISILFQNKLQSNEDVSINKGEL